MKRILLAVFFLFQCQFLHAQTDPRITYMYPKKETDLSYHDPVQRIYAGRIKIAVANAHFAIDTVGTAPNTPEVQFQVPAAFNSGGAA